MCLTSLRHNIEMCIPCVEHSDPQLTWHSSSEGQLSNTKWL